MGACECENPMEFGYEVNAQEKDEKTSTKNKYNQNASNNNYNNNVSNVISSDSNRGKENFYNNKAQIYEINEDENYNDKHFEEEEEKKEGVDALRARYENEKNPNDESDEFFQSNNNNNKQQVLFNTSIDEPGDDFSKYIFDGINKIREHPQSFIKTIENAKKNIINDKKGICVYKSSVKVALSKGIPAFDEAIDYLNNLQPMQKLLFSPELLVIPPENEDQIKDKTYMNEIINEKVQSGIPIKSFWRDIIKDRDTCLILMIVDDTGANSGKKRNDILDPTMQFIGITSKKIGKSFASYITLC